MDEKLDTTGLPRDLSDAVAYRWAALLAKITWAVLIIGIAIGVVFWVTASGDFGQDLGALSWCLTGAICVALMSVRQGILGERK
ncbi:hypothetical protein SAMN05421878_101108 [Actinobaculum suis]|nr:hypothetical protein [Actinobaculum suis]KMY24030.1 hypothetical protein ACU19_00500 [Actinobaculum suis]MDY5153933.1 hypothetical protein [Actinobaculum suis]OCA95635.1 hypothetical protein ACU20_00200 [Actinobaculum suis]OCA95900.1 hypothetical protein ACU21_00200 [Actinobaculum suis]SDE01634.1 hypothetical protein SAMN05421878_101108 [Actinobaculum suis]